VTERCGACRGTGADDEHPRSPPCAVCEGSGRVPGREERDDLADERAARREIAASLRGRARS